MEVTEWTVSLSSGAVAGFSVDMFLYPIDTLKTRLQSQRGLMRAGGFKQLYAGIGSVALGSAPGAAVFFTAYESSRKYLMQYTDSSSSQITCDMIGASVGEATACLVRVPVEVIKQRAQISTQLTSSQVFFQSIREEGMLVLFRGYKVTILREVPFSFIQFPLWEILKQRAASSQNLTNPTWLQSAASGFIAGGIAAALTTPLDVVKTRIMLASKNDESAVGGVFSVMTNICKKEGVHVLFSGLVPRVIWISVGGFIFLGMYDAVKSLLTPVKKSDKRV